MPTERPSPRPLFEDDQLYSAKEIAKKIGGNTHVVTVWRWARKGRLGKAHKIAPGTTRFSGRELNEKLIAAN